MSVKCREISHKPLSIGIDFDIGISDGLSLRLVDQSSSNVRPSQLVC